MRFAEIKKFLNEVSTKHKDMVTLEIIGTSYEKRNIYAVKISNNKKNTKGIYIDANMHAREWITFATAIWIINELVTNRSSILDGIDWYIIPMLNPDGYEYTHTVDRMWSKTRSANSGSDCVGADINRNFPYQFGGEGTSSNPCSKIFKGSTPQSEIEARVDANYMQSLTGKEGFNLSAYISFQAYGQKWLQPWGYTSGAQPDDSEDQTNLAKKVVAVAIYAVNGTIYESGPGADIEDGMGGSSMDYAKAIGIKFSVTILMRDIGQWGFLLPADQIDVNAREIYAALGEVATVVRAM